MKKINPRVKNENIQAAVIIGTVFLLIGLLTWYSISIN